VRGAGVARFVAARRDRKAYLGLHVTVGLGVAALALWLFGAPAVTVEAKDPERATVNQPPPA
jgi:hypothetical protein